MLLDLYWITQGGGDPVQLLKDYPSRFKSFYLKDMDKTSKRLYTCPGYGTNNFKKIFAQVQKTSVRHYIVEIDEADRPLTCV